MCLYWLAPSDDAQSVAVAEEHGFHLVDTRMTFERSLVEPVPAENGGNVRLAVPSDLNALRQTARSGFHDSRFHYDPGFVGSAATISHGDPSCENSFGGYADFVLVGDDNGQPAGFVTCNIESGESGSIGLIAVDSACRGRGLGRQLVTAALRSFSDRGMRVATVVTQGRNIRALAGAYTQKVRICQPPRSIFASNTSGLVGPVPDKQNVSNPSQQTLSLR